LLAAAQAIGDPNLIASAEGRRAPAFLELGDLAGSEASAAHKKEIVRERELTGWEWSVNSADALAAILRGDFAQAERLANRAVEAASGIGDEVVTGIYGVQMFTIRRELGRLAEVAPLLRRFLDESPQDAAWRPGLALIAGDLGFREAAAKSFEVMARAGLISQPTPSAT
jgi:hypothetical protein